MSHAYPLSPTLTPQVLYPQVLYEDTHLVVLDKPAGLLSQGEHSGDPNLVDWLRGHFGRNYVGMVHRLDRNTSGLMVVAKRTKSAQRLTDALQKGKLIRDYQAWLVGELREKQRWEHWLLKDEATNTVRAVRDGTPQAKKSVLVAQPLQEVSWRGQRLTLVEFRLETGRSHQIRVQAAAQGLPLLGDSKYLPRGTPQILHDFPRPALHSHRLIFPHPMAPPSEKPLEFFSPLPADLAKVLVSSPKDPSFKIT